MAVADTKGRRQTQLCLARCRRCGALGHGAAQNQSRHRARACALSGQPANHHRHDRRPGSTDLAAARHGCAPGSGGKLRAVGTTSNGRSPVAPEGLRNRVDADTKALGAIILSQKIETN